jgi:hypothetical protein
MTRELLDQGRALLKDIVACNQLNHDYRIHWTTSGKTDDEWPDEEFGALFTIAQEVCSRCVDWQIAWIADGNGIFDGSTATAINDFVSRNIVG